MVIDTFDAKNQYMIKTQKEIIFQSYDTIMFTYNVIDKTIYFNTDEDNYTKTTCKYLGLALEKLIDRIGNDADTKKIRDLLNSNNRKKFILSLYKGVYELWLQV